MSMTNEEYFVALMSANSADEVLEIQAEFAEDRAIDLSPIGGSDNNSSDMENMENVVRAHNETITNGVDSLVSLHMENCSFKGSPKSPREAQKECANLDQGVYVITSTPTNPVVGKRKLANVLTVDEGTGIRDGNFGDTIMSLNGSNKVSNPLSMGTYGQGCKAILGFSNKGVAVIYSRSMYDPENIYFTVTSMIVRPGWKAASYQWQNEGGKALRIRTSALPAKLIVPPSAFTTHNVLKLARNHIVIGDSGLGYKTFELTDFSSPMVVYNHFRENNFGLPVPVHFHNGVSDKNSWEADKTYSKGTQVRIGDTIYSANETHPSGKVCDMSKWNKAKVNSLYNIRGLRYRLLPKDIAKWESETDYKKSNRASIGGKVFVAKKAHNSGMVLDISKWSEVTEDEIEKSISDYTVRWSEVDVPILHDDKGVAQATISLWFIEEPVGKIKRSHDKLDRPIYSMLSKDRWHRACFVTAHGQTHFNIPTKTRLRNAEMPYLDGHVIIEIKCDTMSTEYKRQMFTSNREGAKEGMRNRINDEIEKYLADRRLGQLGLHHDSIRDKSISSAAPQDNMSHLKRFTQLMKTPLMGSLFSSLGLAGGRRKDFKGRKDPVKKIFAGRAIPDEISVSNLTFEPGQKRYISVRTNALPNYDDNIALVLPRFLTEITRMPIDNGRVSIRVQCAEDTPYGTTGEIKGVIDRSVDKLPNLECLGQITVKKETKTKKSGNNGTMLNPNIIAVDGRSDANWSYMEASEIAEADAAYHYEVLNGQANIYVNMKFGPLVDTIMEIKNKWSKTDGLADRFKSDYLMAVQFSAFAEIDNKIDDSDMSTIWLHAMRAGQCKVQAFMMFVPLLEARGSNRKSSAGDEIVAIQEAEDSTRDMQEAA